MCQWSLIPSNIRRCQLPSISRATCQPLSHNYHTCKNHGRTASLQHSSSSSSSQETGKGAWDRRQQAACAAPRSREATAAEYPGAKEVSRETTQASRRSRDPGSHCCAKQATAAPLLATRGQLSCAGLPVHQHSDSVQDWLGNKPSSKNDSYQPCHGPVSVRL
ncbi:hypothetical protein BD289DRAFT_434478 [Coniella lustricola]|uniref:Uncharacterized protein n=1 Tax=Coniella lustricola TaxID=2025994 RepID=A0A2T3A7D9_9PEZI|nr:hypothetical protein BD289DRAFT_434478 [Coniella lustricola]